MGTQKENALMTVDEARHIVPPAFPPKEGEPQTGGLVDLHPLLDGPDSLRPNPLDDVRNVTLCRYDATGVNSYHELLTVTADDIFACAAAVGKAGSPFPPNASLVHATLLFLFKESPTPTPWTSHRPPPSNSSSHPTPLASCASSPSTISPPPQTWPNSRPRFSSPSPSRSPQPSPTPIPPTPMTKTTAIPSNSQPPAHYTAPPPWQLTHGLSRYNTATPMPHSPFALPPLPSALRPFALRSLLSALRLFRVLLRALRANSGLPFTLQLSSLIPPVLSRPVPFSHTLPTPGTHFATRNTHPLNRESP